MEIITNNAPRELISGYELPDAARAEFDYYNADELDQALFFKYRGDYYDVAEFMRISPNAPAPMREWHGHMGQSYFSGLLIKLSNDGDAVTVARCYS